MNKRDIDRTLLRISHEIIEKNKGVQDLVIIGIKTRGEYLARRISENIYNIEKRSIPKRLSVVFTDKLKERL